MPLLKNIVNISEKIFQLHADFEYLLLFSLVAFQKNDEFNLSHSLTGFLEEKNPKD